MGDHSHGHAHHSHHHGPPKGSSSSRILQAFCLNLGFALIELIGGLMTNSVAILSDALHDFGDSLTLGMAWYFERVSRKGNDHRYSYGYRRFSLLSALITGGVLLCGSVWILSESVQRLLSPAQVDARGMLGLAFLGVAVNGIAYWRLHGGSSHNERAVSLHLLEDVMGWVAVMIGSVVMLIWDVPWVDAVLSISIALFIAYKSVGRIRQVAEIFLQKVPDAVDMADLRSRIARTVGVDEVLDLHVWSLDGEDLISTLSLRSRLEGSERSRLRHELLELLKQRGSTHVSIEILSEGEEKLLC